VSSGKKLIWEMSNKKAESKNIDLSIDPRITSSKLLTPNDICKTSDKSPDYSLNPNSSFSGNGFPVSQLSASGKSVINVLMFPLTYGDSKWNDTQIDVMRKTSLKVSEFYNRVSYGRVKMNFIFLDRNLWWHSTESLHSGVNSIQSVNVEDKIHAIQSIINTSSSSINFDSYDSIVFITGPNEPNGEAFRNYQYSSDRGNAKNFVLGGGGLLSADLLAHELGHALFYFDDLYLFASNYFRDSTHVSSGAPGFGGPGNWDLMAGGNGNNFLTLTGWNRLLAGFIHDDEFRCITNQSSSVHYLSDIDQIGGIKNVLINVEDGVTIAAESRINENSNQGLLVYFIDSYIGHGWVPVRAASRLLGKGESVKLGNFKFTVLDTNKSGVLFQVDSSK
jgi:hypothetical protein